MGDSMPGQALTLPLWCRWGVVTLPPAQEEEADDAFFRQPGTASQSQALVLVGEFYHFSVCCRAKWLGRSKPGHVRGVWKTNS